MDSTLADLLFGVLATVFVLVAALIGALVLVATPLGGPMPALPTVRKQALVTTELLDRSAG